MSGSRYGRALNAQIQDLEASRDAAIRREQKIISQRDALFERLTSMIDEEDVPDEYGRGRREGWNVALYAALELLAKVAP